MIVLYKRGGIQLFIKKKKESSFFFLESYDYTYLRNRELMKKDYFIAFHSKCGSVDYWYQMLV
jgi:hypothetical protein